MKSFNKMMMTNSFVPNKYDDNIDKETKIKNKMIKSESKLNQKNDQKIHYKVKKSKSASHVQSKSQNKTNTLIESRKDTDIDTKSHIKKSKSIPQLNKENDSTTFSEMIKTKSIPINTEKKVKFGKTYAFDERENKRIIRIKKEAEEKLTAKINEFKYLLCKDKQEIKFDSSEEQKENLDQELQEWIEFFSDFEIEKCIIASERNKKNNDYDEMYQSVQDMYIVAVCALKLINIDKYQHMIRISLERMDFAAENASIPTNAEHGIFLYRLKAIESPDYSKIGKFLKKAGLNGDKYCLSLYLSLVDEELIINNNISELGKLYEKLSHYEFRSHNKKKSEEYFQIAAQYYRKGVLSSQPESMVRYGILIEEGRIKDKNFRPIQMYKKGSQMSHPDSMFKYAESIEKSGTLNRSELNKATELYIKAASLNNPSAMFRYAQIIEDTCMIKSDRLKAIDFYRKAAEMNHPDAMFKYAQILEKGIYVRANKNQALYYYKKAADSEELKYVLYYAILIKTGRLGYVNFKESINYIKLAYELDENESFLSYSYALMYNHGVGVPVNIPLAIEYYKKAADEGNVEAMFDYAMIFHNGQGVRANKWKAAKYYKMAADKGHAEARFNYELILKTGYEIPVSQEQSDHCLLMAGNRK